MSSTTASQPLAEYTRYSPLRRIAVAAGILLGLLMFGLDMTIVNVAIPSMMGNLGVTIDQVNWVATGYMLAMVIVLPLTGWLEARCGRRRLLVSAVVLFTGSSLLCGLAHSLGVLVFFRILQGIGGAPLMATGLATLLDVFPPEQAGTASAVLGIGVMVGPAVGPIIGGWLVDNYAWPWVFFINLPAGVLATIALFMAMKKPRAEHLTKRPLDVVGLLELILGLSCLQVLLENGEREGWMDSTPMCWLLALTIGALLLFVYRSLTTADPLVNLRVFKYRQLAAGSLFNFAVGTGLFGTLFLLPVFLQNLRQYTALQSGVIMLPWAIASAIFMGVAAGLVVRCSPRLLIAVGILCCVTGMVRLSRVTYLSGPEHLFWPQVLIGGGIGLQMVPLITASLSGITGLELGDASGLFNMLRQLGGSIGIALLSTLIDKRIVFHHAILAENVNVYNTETLTRFTMLQQLFLSKGAALADATRQALTVLDQTITSQAVLLAYEDVFLIIALTFALTLPLILLFRETKSGEAPVNMPMP